MILSPIDPKQPLQTEYSQAVADLVSALRTGLASNLHSVYVYGSVARRCALLHRSNLDVIIVSHQSFAQQRTTLFNTIKWQFQKRYPHITEINFKTAMVSEVASLDSIFSWGFLLRHCAMCVYGENLSECFGDYEPSWEIAKHWNMDIEDWLAVYRNRIARAKDDQELHKSQRIIAKKMLRASYSLVIPRDRNWYDSPLECGKHFLRYHPEMQVEVERLVIMLSSRVIPKRSIIGMIDSYGDWLVKQYKKTEFRIG
ncbi:nucleotidyltransferase [Vibrio panuliri]|uniref:Nucleotidyltransferase n=1 Tax=Vibrio panuliri TaxID=1381081 RepID=A0ABX3FP92_9VIBR|nr:nucleotidyltransferase [Vibrio panuliri]KAB1455519.1 nucleotidyltransferase domain-containing protein [Vibrio panuliri]OLQ96065.1 nucleotidyltransferase [Vibrio panuliri]